MPAKGCEIGDALAEIARVDENRREAELLEKKAPELRAQKLLLRYGIDPPTTLAGWRKFAVKHGVDEYYVKMKWNAGYYISKVRGEMDVPEYVIDSVDYEGIAAAAEHAFLCEQDALWREQDSTTPQSDAERETKMIAGSLANQPNAAAGTVINNFNFDRNSGAVAIGSPRVKQNITPKTTKWDTLWGIVRWVCERFGVKL